MISELRFRLGPRSGSGEDQGRREHKTTERCERENSGQPSDMPTFPRRDARPELVDGPLPAPRGGLARCPARSKSARRKDRRFGLTCTGGQVQRSSRYWGRGGSISNSWRMLRKLDGSRRRSRARHTQELGVCGEKNKRRLMVQDRLFSTKPTSSSRSRTPTSFELPDVVGCNAHLDPLLSFSNLCAIPAESRWCQADV